MVSLLRSSSEAQRFISTVTASPLGHQNNGDCKINQVASKAIPADLAYGMHSFPSSPAPPVALAWPYDKEPRRAGQYRVHTFWNHALGRGDAY